MTTPRNLRILTIFALVSLVSGCRTSPKNDCERTHVFRDSAGWAMEKERIGVQWIMFRGALDSMLSTRSGAAAWERAPRSLEENLSRYADSLKLEDGVLRMGDGCVDWNDTWAQGDFDRFALATAMVRTLFADSTLPITQLITDSADIPRFLDLDIPGGEQGQSTVRIELDSVFARLFSRN